MTEDELRQGFRHEIAAAVCVVLFLLYATASADPWWSTFLALGGVACGVAWMMESVDR